LIRAELKRLHSPDVFNLEDFQPDGSFGILVQAMVGPSSAPGEESFGIIVCTPAWFADRMAGDIYPGRHHLFVRRYDFHLLKKYLERYCSTCTVASWHEVAEKLGRLGHWEFEDYKP
jgi:hypothetical protein